MSTNPYAAPRAQVSDATLVSQGNFLPTGRTVPTGNGWTWIADAWALFRAGAGTWIAIVLVLAVIYAVLGILPLVGAVAGMVLAPVFTGGLMAASRNAAEGHLQFADAFAGFRQRFGALATVGVVSLVATVAIVFIASVVTGVGMFSVLNGATTPEQLARVGITLALTLLVMLALMLPLIMAIWFAPALIVFHDLAAVEAMKASVLGSAKNMLPFFLYGIVLTIASVIASIPLLLGWLVLGPVIIASIYTSYRDIYFSAA